MQNSLHQSPGGDEIYQTMSYCISNHREWFWKYNMEVFFLSIWYIFLIKTTTKELKQTEEQNWKKPWYLNTKAVFLVLTWCTMFQVYDVYLSCSCWDNKRWCICEAHSLDLEKAKYNKLDISKNLLHSYYHYMKSFMLF